MVKTISLLCSGLIYFMGIKKSVIGNVFGRLTVISDRKTIKTIKQDGTIGYNYLVTVRCECGVVKNVFYPTLNKNCGVLSCGCYRRDFMTEKHTTQYGLSRTKEYRAWHGMIKRCYNKKYNLYHRYGGRGIIVCDRWLNSFELFLNDMGKCPPNKKSIDRKENDGNYEPNNCRWATDKEQSNNRSTNNNFEINGVVKNMQQWCDVYGADYKRVWQRVFDLGWDIEKALTVQKILGNPKSSRK